MKCKGTLFYCLIIKKCTMNCKTLFSGSMNLHNLRKMPNDCRRALLQFLFDNRSSLNIPPGFFTCFFNPIRSFVNPVDLYNVCRASNITSMEIVKLYIEGFSWFVRVSQSYSARF